MERPDRTRRRTASIAIPDPEPAGPVRPDIEAIADLPGRYAFVREIGRGGMGTVLLVRDSYLGKEVALKLLHDAPDPEDLEQAEREFVLLARMDHPGVARAHDFGSMAGRPYFTRDFVRGKPLGESSSGASFLDTARKLVEAVAYLHGSGVLHLDIKPQNIIVRNLRAERLPVLIDFGLCRRGVSRASERKLRGSLPYMGPECFHGGDLGPWTDIYAIGATLYQAATGRLPRQPPGPSGIESRRDLTWSPVPPSLSSFGANLDEDLERILFKCLALDPSARFPTAAELLDELDRLRCGRSAPRARPAPSLLPTIGRDGELATIDRFLNGVDGRTRGSGARSPGLLFVTGPSGMGHTHILRELWMRAQTRGLRAYLETGRESGPAIPGALLRSLGPHLDPEARRRWNGFLARLRRPRTSSHDAGSESDLRARRAAEVAHAAGALQDPFLLVVDGLHFFDEISVDLIVQLARVLSRRPAGSGPPASLALSYREEGPALPFLRELADLIFEPDLSIVLPLGPLGPKEAAELHGRACSRGELHADARKKAPQGLEIYQTTSGVPARIVELAERGSLALDAPADPRGAVKAWASLPQPDRKVLLALRLLGRPGKTARIARIAGVSRPRADIILRRLSGAGLVRREPAGFVAEPGLVPPAYSNPAESRMRAAIARDLLRESRGGDGSLLGEALHHARKAGEKTLFRKHALRLARYLKSTNQNRTALEVLRGLLEATPAARLQARTEIALAMAELQARVGQIEDGIETLGALLGRRAGIGPVWRARLLLRLAMLHGRKGDFRKAEALFDEGLRRDRAHPARLRNEELLFFRNEQAAIKAFVGDYGEASRLCEEGLQLVGRGRDAGSRQLLLDLHATRAQVALRQFEFEKAMDGFELALGIAEGSGALVNKAVILNNLGIVYSQCDRCREAIDAFRAAERVCLRLDEGPSLTFVYGNLALLHSKMGDFEASERYLAEAGKLSLPRAGAPGSEWSRREELFHDHHRGVSLLYRGRPSEALPSLEAAIDLGRSMGDRFVTSFDEVYRGEALILQGSYAEASTSLRRISRHAGLRRLRLMAASRLAYLFALTGQDADLAEALAIHGGIQPERTVPFLDAWDDLFIGWASSMAGIEDPGADRLARAEEYFERNGMKPGASLASWARAEARFLAGDIEGASSILEGLPSGSDLVSALAPLLWARLALENAPTAEGMMRASDALSRAGSALVRNRLPEWSQRLESLKLCLSPGATDRVADQRRELSLGLPASARKAFLRSRHWNVWTERFDRAAWQLAPGDLRTEEDALPATTATVLLRRRSIDAARGRIVARSESMREVLDALDRFRENELPVVIVGETGTGKELVARVLHAESLRFAKPFRVLDCATLPTALADVELFGAREGAFTDLQGDRSGILEEAAGGTLLIEGVADSPGEIQAKLLRVLSEGTYRAVGADSESRADVRFIFSATGDLEEESRSGRLRQDLLHRMRVLTIDVPPLRKRLEDVEGLIDLFLREGDGPRPALEKGVVESLRGREWPGNVRELRNVVARLRFEHPRVIPLEAVSGDAIRTDAFRLPQELLQSESLDEIRGRVEREYILHHFRRLRGDMGALGKLLGLSGKYCYRRLKELGIDIREERRGMGAARMPPGRRRT